MLHKPTLALSSGFCRISLYWHCPLGSGGPACTAEAYLGSVLWALEDLSVAGLPGFHLPLQPGLDTPKMSGKGLVKIALLLNWPNRLTWGMFSPMKKTFFPGLFIDFLSTSKF